MSGLIAIVGRPNVGKSALFNRIIGRRVAIVHDEAGVTRDRVSFEAEWDGHPFTIVDTGGIGLVEGERSEDIITKATIDQVELAIGAADVILYVVNIQDGIVPLDEEVATRLRQYNRPVILVTNKADNARIEEDLVEFSKLGFDKIFPVSAIHGRGLLPLMRETLSYLPEKPEVEDGKESEEDPLKICIVGRPNVGKSSIINSLTQSDRVIVSDIAGTTRDAIDVPFEIETEGRRQTCLLIDTAGVRKKSKIDDSVEFFSVKRTETAVERSDIAVLVIDAETGITEQDKKICDKINEEKKAAIIVVNKWDLVGEDVVEARKEEVRRRKAKERRDRNHEPMTTLSEFAEWIQKKLFFMSYAPVVFTSANSGFQLDRLLETIRYVSAQLDQKIPTSLINRTLQDAVVKRMPSMQDGHRLKIYYATQVSKAPPSFLLFVNKKDALTPHYEKYLSEEMRTAFGYEGCPILLHAKERPKKVDPVRTARRKAAAQNKTRSKEENFPFPKRGGKREPDVPKKKRVTKQALKAREGQKKKK